jgi:hypothetical protein
MRLLCILLILVSPCVIGDSSSLNLAIPQSQQSYQSDRIRAGDLECQNAIGSSTNVEFGVVGIINQNDPFGNSGVNVDPNYNYNNSDMVKDIGVYAKITIPIGAPKERLNCNTLYLLELEKKRLEVMKLKAEIQSLKTLKFEN